jgi:hypothetical protein
MQLPAMAHTYAVLGSPKEPRTRECKRMLPRSSGGATVLSAFTAALALRWDRRQSDLVLRRSVCLARFGENNETHTRD